VMVRVADAVMLGVAVGVLVASGMAVDVAVGVRVGLGAPVSEGEGGVPKAGALGYEPASVGRKATAASVGCGWETRPSSTPIRSTELQSMGNSPRPKAASPMTAKGPMASAHTTGVRISPTRAVSRNVGRRVERRARAGARRRSRA